MNQDGQYQQFSNRSYDLNNQQQQQISDLRYSLRNSQGQNELSHNNDNYISNIDSAQKKQNSIFQRLIDSVFKKQIKVQSNVKNQIIGFLIFAILFLLIGIIIIVMNSKIQEIIIDNYQKESICTSMEQQKNQHGTQNCNIKVEITQDIQPPIYLFYTINNMYQNHRIYQQSKSSQQLVGEKINLDTAKLHCSPIVYNKDLKLKNLISYDNRPLDPNAIANPCGLIAKSYFNDSYKLYDNSQQRINIGEKHISWPGDKGNKYKKAKSQSDIQWVNPEDEHFIVWMRTAGLSNFRRLWGIIDKPLLASKSPYSLEIENNYDVKDMNGSKGIVFSTSNILGGKHKQMAYGFISISCIFFIITIYYYLHFKKYNSAIKQESNAINTYKKD